MMKFLICLENYLVVEVLASYFFIRVKTLVFKFPELLSLSYHLLASFHFLGVLFSLYFQLMFFNIFIFAHPTNSLYALSFFRNELLYFLHLLNLYFHVSSFPFIARVFLQLQLIIFVKLSIVLQIKELSFQFFLIFIQYDNTFIQNFTHDLFQQ